MNENDDRYEGRSQGASMTDKGPLDSANDAEGEANAGSSAMRLYRRSAQRSRRRTLEPEEHIGPANDGLQKQTPISADPDTVVGAEARAPSSNTSLESDLVVEMPVAPAQMGDGLKEQTAHTDTGAASNAMEPPPLPPEAVIHPVGERQSQNAEGEERRGSVGRRADDQSAEVEDLSVRAEAREQSRRAEREARMTPRVVASNAGLEVRSLGKQFKKRPVLRDVTLSVQRGEAVGLLGPNGAGKTTCFYIITGLITADYGEIFLDGQDITELPMYRRARLGVGYLPQEASIFRGLTVEDNIRAVLELIEKNRDRREATLDALLAEFSISHLRRTPAIALSGGERRRLEIARALATQPNFILLDEPLAGIDPIAVRDIRELVRHLKDRGIGVLITDHNVRETLEIVDRAYILHDGGVLMEGIPQDIVANEDVRRVYLGDRFTL